MSPSSDADLRTSALDAVAEEKRFSGVVAAHRDGKVEFAKAYGHAHRGFGVPNTLGTRFAIASGTKGFTALAVVSLVADGPLTLDTPARSVLGADLPLIGDDVTIEQLLAHRSGIGDYFDEESGGEITDYALPVPVHTLFDLENYLSVLGGHPAKFPAGERFSYCNSGYVVLALIAERVAKTPFADLVAGRVCEPAGLTDTAFLRYDLQPGGVAVGYLGLDGDQTNVLHLPVRGGGDGGLSSTAADVAAFWSALFAGRIVPPQWVERMVTPTSDVPAEKRRYGLGFRLAPSGDRVLLEGYDAGVSFRSTHDPGSRLTLTVLANTSEGAWPMARRLAELYP